MTDMSYTGFPPDETTMSLPASVNADYNQANDDEILSYTSDESYWWLTEEKLQNYHVGAAAIATQFTDFFNAVMNQDIVPATSDIHRFFTPDRIDVPGLAERPPNDGPNHSASSVSPELWQVCKLR